MGALPKEFGCIVSCTINYTPIQYTAFSSDFWARGRAAGLSRGIFPGAGKRTVPMQQPTAPRKDTLRISLARFASLRVP